MNYNDIKSLDQIILKTAQAIEDGKKEIFEIAEKARHDYMSYESELIGLRSRLSLLINHVDKLQIRSQMARNMIKTINEHFDEFSEKDIKEAYELSEKSLVELSLKRQEEKELSDRRNELDRLMRDSREVLQKSEVLEMKVSVALEYLNSSLGEQLQDIQAKKDIGIRIIEAQENEKKRISRDIHDGPAQSLANLILKAEYASKMVDVSPKKAKKELSELQTDVRDTLKDIRRIIYDLMPMSLDDLGLVPTIKKMLSNISENSSIKINVKIHQEGVIDNTMLNLMVFRVVQEILNNTVKHSQCKNIDFMLSILTERVEMDVKDDGLGFDVNHAFKEAKGFGLYNIKERVEIVGGIIDIQSMQKQGTHIKINIPNK